MKKQIISNDDKKVNIVILKNDSLGISVKGISKCHPEDIYDRDKGIKIANTKAWIKYYQTLIKVEKRELDFHNEILEWQKGIIEESQHIMERAENKIPELQAELEKIMGE